MKITEVEAIELRLPEPEIEYKATAAQDALIIKIHTDAGIVGIGEVDSSLRMAKAVVEAPMSNTVATGLGRLLIGMNPLDIEVINEKLYRESFYCGRRAVVVHTIGGIDMALWDIAGKFYRQPIYQLLGEPFKSVCSLTPVTFSEPTVKKPEKRPSDGSTRALPRSNLAGHLWGRVKN